MIQIELVVEYLPLLDQCQIHGSALSIQIPKLYFSHYETGYLVPAYLLSNYRVIPTECLCRLGLNGSESLVWKNLSALKKVHIIADLCNFTLWHSLLFYTKIYGIYVIALASHTGLVIFKKKFPRIPKSYLKVLCTETSIYIFRLPAEIWGSNMRFQGSSGLLRTSMQIFLKTIKALSCWYSLDSSHWVLSLYESKCARIFCLILYWPN